MAAFIRHIQEQGRGRTAPPTDYQSLYEWSIAHPEQFWAAMWDFGGIIASRRWDEVLVGGGRMPGAKWFTGARLNFAENLLRYRDDREAIVFRSESGLSRRLTYAELCRQVARLSTAMRGMGVTAGDCVAGYLPNIPETVIAMLATASLGAVWSSCSPDFGVQGLMDRFGQIAPKLLFAADGYFYNGKWMDLTERVGAVASQLPSLQAVIIVPYDALPSWSAKAMLSHNRGNVAAALRLGWNDLLARGEGGNLEFAQLPFDHPLYIMYSSGTTGLPKSIIHGAGGTLIQHLKELLLHTDLKRDDRIFYYTTCGWMMWNWLVSSLAVGATVLLYDGAPLYPQPASLWDFAEQERMTVFGTSAKYLSALEKGGVKPRETHDLSALRAILSTGSPLAPESFDYVYREIKSDVQLSSISGGTDIISCFALGNPVAPVYRGELQTRGLGMKVLVYNEAGEPVAGEKGELVCAAPFPSMPVGFWNDSDGSRYRRAYFERFPGVWHHGDYAELNPETGGMVIYGRSDATLNPGGVRLGTAEIYRQVEQIPEVLEALAVGQEWEGSERIILFVRLRDGQSLSEELIAHIKEQIRRNTTPHHVPKKMIAVANIPRTISGKMVELAVRDVIHGRPVKNIDALANPQALELFRGLRELGE